MISDEPLMLYPDVEKDDGDDDDADEDYDALSAYGDDNDDNDEEDEISILVKPLSSTTVNQWQKFLDMGSGGQIDDLIESNTVRLPYWNDAIIDLQLGMRFFKTNIASYCQQSRDPCLGHHLRSPSITSDGLYVQEDMVCSEICSRKGVRQLGDNFYNSTQISPSNERFKLENCVLALASQNEHSLELCFIISFLVFEPCINRFHNCRPVITVDGTHLRGPSKGVLLIANTWDANNHLSPLHL
ncbi:hypothetical protein M9H77_19250 [Catharanthus roseus]|uniref:Uncharacterized protein n=1 Tax=Catharanthus roseus TaxID=4058 RepID=A0ACC0B9W9_CATRO|nr:hypothetical protein M9H77_19250 [Catharanthus roseus]